MVLRIYLADLVYDTIKTNYVIPLNVGFIAAYTKEKFGSQVDVTIFKYPTELEAAIVQSPPDILALSHYSWNSRLGYLFCKMTKRLNPKIITVRGGPQIRSDPEGIRAHLLEHPAEDYHIIHEGEEAFANLVGELLQGNTHPTPAGCAGIIDGEFHYTPTDYSGKSRDLTIPSPYLTGLLDKFLKDPEMIPLLETNRGCPYGCVYCQWGLKTLSKLRLRPLDVIFREIDYIAEHCASQVLWWVCDGNFGIIPRDIEIAKKIREVQDRKGFPVTIGIYDAKNTSSRNIEIAKIVKGKEGYVAIQSADPVVLEKSGRGFIRIDDMKKTIQHYKDSQKEVSTDILIGLPGESYDSHLQSLMAAFEIGFDYLMTCNIRLLPGTSYESKEFREKYQVKTKYRPIFGAYGRYDNQLVFELEESVRSTIDMSEQELNDFKILHWLIYFAWNGGLYTPLLKVGQKYGLNPAAILDKVAHSENPLLKSTFNSMREQSMKEWFKTPEEMVHFYEQQDHFEELVNNFAKLNFLWIGVFYQNKELIQALELELIKIMEEELKTKGTYDKKIINQAIALTSEMICKDPLEGESCRTIECSGEVLSVILNDTGLASQPSVTVEVYRPKESVSFCYSYLNPGGKIDLSLKNLSRFFEMKGLRHLKNKVRVAVSNPVNEVMMAATAQS